tara:strand:+ start:3945 stop:4304 length:360 start_codon:yes stop_codon:yes gene_type:complete
MKKFAQEFAKPVAISGLKTIKVVSIGTLGLASTILGTASNCIAAGCNTGIKKLKGKKTTFNEQLVDIHDYQHLANKIMDGRVSIVEAYDSVVPEKWKIVMEYLSQPYRKAAMDINQGRL